MLYNVQAREFKKPLRVLRARYFILGAQGGHTTSSFAYLRHCKKYHARHREKRTRTRSIVGVLEKKNKSFAARPIDLKYGPSTQHASLLVEN